MKFGEWYREGGKENAAFDCRLEGRSAQIVKKTKEYAVEEIFLKVDEIQKPGLYDFVLEMQSDGLKTKTLLSWYDTENREVKREYVKSIDTVYIPEGTRKLVLAVTCYGTEPGTVTVQNVALQFKQEYQKRIATLAALPIDYGLECEHWKRTGEDNLNDSLRRIDSLMQRFPEVDLIVLTECFYSRNCFAAKDVWLSIDSPQIDKMRDKAKQHGVYLAFSFKEKAKDGILYNTALLIDRKGEISAVYHKTHLTVSEYEDGMKPGDEAVVVDTDFGRVGFAICWDFFFPEFCRLLQQKGAEIIINPTAGFMQEQSIMRARDNGVYVINSTTTFGTTKIFNPEGEEIATADGRGVAIAEVDLEQEFLVRYLSVSKSSASRRNIYMNERRPDLYQSLAQT